MTNPPSPFENLKHLAEQGDATQRAKDVGAALQAIPDLQKWLREQRQQVVLTLHERDGISYTDMAPALGVKPERVSGIARGHSRAPRKKISDE